MHVRHFRFLPVRTTRLRSGACFWLPSTHYTDDEHEWWSVMWLHWCFDFRLYQLPVTILTKDVQWTWRPYSSSVDRGWYGVQWFGCHVRIRYKRKP